ncbi:MAG: alpha/beta hydrolase [Proteobacteria bacterium]|nr:alpha/beta hydrolase [Pseudomonadota bacterium]
MNWIFISLVALITFIIPHQVHAQVTETLQLRPGVTQNILFLRPTGKPKASVILFAGGDGEIGIQSDGTIESDGNFLVRSRDIFQKYGLLVAVYDMPNEVRSRDRYRLSDDHPVDSSKLIARLRAMAPVPVWLVGTSRGTISVAHIAAELKGANGPNGVVFSAAVTEMSNSGRPEVSDAKVKNIRVPALIVHHKDDECYVTPWREQDDLLDDLKNSPRKQLIGLEGGNAGSPGDECTASSHHGFLDIEEKAVRVMTDWIRATTP